MLPVLKSQKLQFGKGAAGERGQRVSLHIARTWRGGELLAAGGSGREQDFPEQGPAMALCCQCEGELMSFEPPVLLPQVCDFQLVIIANQALGSSINDFSLLQVDRQHKGKELSRRSWQLGHGP